MFRLSEDYRFEPVSRLEASMDSMEMMAFISLAGEIVGKLQLFLHCKFG